MIVALYFAALLVAPLLVLFACFGWGHAIGHPETPRDRVIEGPFRSQMLSVCSCIPSLSAYALILTFIVVIVGVETGLMVPDTTEKGDLHPIASLAFGAWTLLCWTSIFPAMEAGMLLSSAHQSVNYRRIAAFV